MWLPPIKVLCAAWIMTALATCTSHPAPVQQPATPPGLPGAGTADVSQAPTGNVAHLAAVRLAGQDGFDRLVLEFADRVPGYTVGYRPLPAHADASGAEIALPGASALLQLTLNPATAEGWGGGARSYFGPSEVRADTASITEAKAAGGDVSDATLFAAVRSPGRRSRSGCRKVFRRGCGRPANAPSTSAAAVRSLGEAPGTTDGGQNSSSDSANSMGS
jgi:hypothetical protein